MYVCTWCIKFLLDSETSRETGRVVYVWTAVAWVRRPRRPPPPVQLNRIARCRFAVVPVRGLLSADSAACILSAFRDPANDLLRLPSSAFLRACSHRNADSYVYKQRNQPNTSRRMFIFVGKSVRTALTLFIAVICFFFWLIVVLVLNFHVHMSCAGIWKRLCRLPKANYTTIFVSQIDEHSKK